MAKKFHLRYGTVTTSYMTGIFFLSSLPGDRFYPGSQLFSNLFHIPLFSGLALCVLLSLNGGQWSRSMPDHLYGAIGLLAGAYAVVDEWHQSFVAGRFASVSDFLLDCLGILGLLLIHRWLSRHGATA